MLTVSYDHSCLSSHREEITYGDWSQDWHFDVKGVVDRGENNEYPAPRGQSDDYNVPGKAGKPAYVLSIVYDEGDSFGRARNKGEVLMVFTDKAMAYEAKERFDKAFDKYGDTNQYCIEIPVQAPDGKRVMFECPHPAGGYFETMREIRLDHFIIT